MEKRTQTTPDALFGPFVSVSPHFFGYYLIFYDIHRLYSPKYVTERTMEGGGRENGSFVSVFPHFKFLRYLIFYDIYRLASNSSFIYELFGIGKQGVSRHWPASGRNSESL